METINCNRKKITNVRIFRGIYHNKNCKIIICDSCNFIDIKNSKCSKCYGVIIKIMFAEKKENDNTTIKKYKTFRDKFIMKNNKIYKSMSASNIFKNIKIINEIDNNLNRQYMWRYYDRPVTYKTDCLECKMKNIITPCQNIEENIRNGFSEHFCQEQKQREMRV